MLTVAPGVPFQIELGSAPGSGCLWQLEALPPGMQLVGSDVPPAAQAAIGSGGTQAFHLRTERSGRFELRFVLKRGWEQVPVQTEVIDVESRRHMCQLLGMNGNT